MHRRLRLQQKNLTESSKRIVDLAKQKAGASKMTRIVVQFQRCVCGCNFFVGRFQQQLDAALCPASSSKKLTGCSTGGVVFITQKCYSPMASSAPSCSIVPTTLPHHICGRGRSHANATTFGRQELHEHRVGKPLAGKDCHACGLTMAGVRRWRRDERDGRPNVWLRCGEEG